MDSKFPSPIFKNIKKHESSANHSRKPRKKLSTVKRKPKIEKHECDPMLCIKGICHHPEHNCCIPFEKTTFIVSKEHTIIIKTYNIF